MKTSLQVVVALVLSCAVLGQCSGIPEVDGLIKSAGYAAERHSIETADGEKLSFVRIPPSGTPAGVVYLQHGLFDSSNTWVLNGAKDSLAFILHDKGYDVWLGNSRGNDYSGASDYHFSWDQCAQFDLPAAVEYITEKTGKKPVYIGHSQGTAMMFASLSRKWTDPASLSGFIALGPIAYLAHETSPLFGAMGTLHADTFLKALIGKPFTLTIDFMRHFVKDKELKYDWFNCLFGKSENLDDSNWHGFFPMQTSAQNVAQWAQMSRTGDFQQYSGSLNPLKKYELYNIKAIALNSIKIGLYVGKNDLLTNTLDVDHLISDIKSKGNLAIVKQYDGYAHMDFTWARNAKDVVYPDVISMLSQMTANEEATTVV